MKHSLQNIRKLDKRIQANVTAGKPKYGGFDAEETACLYKFAIGGRLTQASTSRFNYPDCQSDYKFISSELLMQHLHFLQDEHGPAESQYEAQRLFSCGWVHWRKLFGEDVLCTSEGTTRVENIMQGKHAENARGLNERPEKREKFSQRFYPASPNLPGVTICANPFYPQPS